MSKKQMIERISQLLERANDRMVEAIMRVLEWIFG